MARRGLAVGVAVCLAAAVTAGITPSRAAQTAAPAPLPSSRLEFGLSNLDATWMTSSGVPWRYRFQYLAGGVNTPNPWQTWQDPALPPGQFAVDFMKNSTTAPANYIPVFTYYELLQSTPSTGANESDRDFSNLNNAATMNAYYANFKLLMQKAGAYGAQVVVHVEPDFWGYMQQRAAGGGASAVAAAVASSGFAEAAAYPNTLLGFTSELKYLRDTYAPNALLAMHASMWSTGFDIASSTYAGVNAIAQADSTAAFLNSAGMWDAVFNDVDDHNAAWWELASCGSPPCVNANFTHWWDPANVKFPNFTRYLAWVAELHAQTARPQVVWQVPMGNQYFLTMNNTCGHYQDNVAPYFIAHASDLFAAGLVAVLFGPGNSCQTTNDDDPSRHDGITNNGGRATTDSLGGCTACNTHTSAWADDDGGYLRIFVGQYYGSRCATASVTPSSPIQPAGSSVVLSASSTGCSAPHYEFWVQYPDKRWYLKQGWGGTAFTWNTAGLKPGTYTVHAWANQTGNSTASWEAYGTSTVKLTGCTSASLAPASGSAKVGIPILFTATAKGCPNPMYEFWLQDTLGRWHLMRGFGGPTWTWNNAGWGRGAYHLHVWANQQGAFTGSYEMFGSSTYTLT